GLPSGESLPAGETLAHGSFLRKGIGLRLTAVGVFPFVLAGAALPRPQLSLGTRKFSEVERWKSGPGGGSGSCFFSSFGPTIGSARGMNFTSLVDFAWTKILYSAAVRSAAGWRVIRAV